MVSVFQQLKTFIEDNIDLAGILDGTWAFTGPEMVQIDLTNNCNNDCIACWCRSPLLGDRGASREDQQQILPFEIIERVLHECAEMGTSNIYLSGGGEPFMHPHIMQVVKLIKELGLCCHINSNFTLVDREKASNLVGLGVDHLILSFWAATAETYQHTHPNKTVATFENMVDVLKFLISSRRGDVPHVVLYNVISNYNYHEIEAIVDLAADTGVNAVEFTVVDTIPGATDSLLLSNQQTADVLEACRRIQYKIRAGDIPPSLEVRIDEFVKRLSVPDAIFGKYDQEVHDDFPCWIGWNFLRILADGNVNACLKAHRIPVGNINDQSFRRIWNSRKQRAFRHKTKAGDRNDSFFRLIGNDTNARVGCYKSCDDIERNRRLWRRMNKLSLSQKLLLRVVSICLRVSSSFVYPCQDYRDYQNCRTALRPGE